MSNQFNDDKKAFFERATSEIGSVNDLELYWLMGLTLETTTAVNDLWSVYLGSLGFIEGALNDKQFQWLESLGFGQATLQEKFHAYYSTTP